VKINKYSGQYLLLDGRSQYSLDGTLEGTSKYKGKNRAVL
jgi:hypothetical protein